MSVTLKTQPQKSTAGEADVELILADRIEDTDEFPKVQVRLAQRIVFDCRNLKFVSSYGAQKWSLWMRSFDPRQQFVFREVPERTVDIFNLLLNFLPANRTIESFYVPYQCDSCNHEDVLLARRGKEYIEAVDVNPAKVNVPENINCQACKGQMTLGVWKSKYFRFLDQNSN